VDRDEVTNALAVRSVGSMRASLTLAVLVVACSRQSPAPAPLAELRDAAATSDASATPDADAQPAPLAGFPWQMELTDADAGPATTKLGVVSVPLGAREPRPIMIALHGGSDRPEWACGAWRGITSAYPFLVCPHGVGTNEASLAWSSPADTKARVARAVAATKKIFGSWIRETPIVLVGFSMGATQAALLARSEPLTYRRIGLAESAYAPEPVIAFAEPWAAGGQRAIFLCTTIGCEGPYRTAARNVARHGVPARLNIAGTNEHGMWDAVVRSMRRDWPWFVEGAEGWESYAPPAEETPLPGKTETFEPR
jgi:poly(3-hydroxybutyrate) depolymerase